MLAPQFVDEGLGLGAEMAAGGDNGEGPSLSPNGLSPRPTLRRQWGLAPLCGAGDTFSVSSSTPVARQGGEACGGD